MLPGNGERTYSEKSWFAMRNGGHICGMIALHIRRCLGSATIAASGLGAAVLSVPALPSASAQPCPDVEVAFARGTGEPPGVGPTGQAFVDSLRARSGRKSVDVYPVNYPASNEWSTGVDGIKDAAPMSFRRRRAAPRPRWSSAVTPKARP
jgi:hypothetical protein